MLRAGLRREERFDMAASQLYREAVFNYIAGQRILVRIPGGMVRSVDGQEKEAVTLRR